MTLTFNVSKSVKIIIFKHHRTSEKYFLTL